MIKSGQFEQWKVHAVENSQKSFNANIFVRINFKNLTKKWWNSIFITLYIICKLEQNLPKEVVKEVNGIMLLFQENRTQRQERLLKIGYLVFRTHTSIEYFTNVLNVYTAPRVRENSQENMWQIQLVYPCPKLSTMFPKVVFSLAVQPELTCDGREKKIISSIKTSCRWGQFISKYACLAKTIVLHHQINSLCHRPLNNNTCHSEYCFDFVKTFEYKPSYSG